MGPFDGFEASSFVGGEVVRCEDAMKSMVCRTPSFRSGNTDRDEDIVALNQPGEIGFIREVYARYNVGNDNLTQSQSILLHSKHTQFYAVVLFCMLSECCCCKWNILSMCQPCISSDQVIEHPPSLHRLDTSVNICSYYIQCVI